MVAIQVSGNTVSVHICHGYVELAVCLWAPGFGEVWLIAGFFSKLDERTLSWLIGCYAVTQSLFQCRLIVAIPNPSSAAAWACVMSFALTR